MWSTGRRRAACAVLNATRRSTGAVDCARRQYILRTSTTPRFRMSCWESCSHAYSSSSFSTAQEATPSSEYCGLVSTCGSVKNANRKSGSDASSALVKTTKEKAMNKRQLFHYLQIETFSEDEIDQSFERIRMSLAQPSETNQETESPTEISITHQHLKAFAIKRFREIEESDERGPIDLKKREELLEVHANDVAHRIMFMLCPNANDSSLCSDGLPSPSEEPFLTKESFRAHILQLGSAIDWKHTVQIGTSMFLVGSSVGIVTPVMPFVVAKLGLTAAQYGTVISSFALSKLLANVPAAILVEVNGRKPSLVNSCILLAVGVGGIGFATSYEHLLLCRLLTGVGVSSLSAAATMTIADISTPLNRASTMAPIMSGFAAGMAFGPAIGGMLADGIGISPTFYLVGGSYLGLTFLNSALLEETKFQSVPFPWEKKDVESDNSGKKDQSILGSAREAVGQWVPLMADHRVRSVTVMNGLYWTALAGSQMTILPLMLADPNGLALTASSVGHVYMGMSLVQVMSNPVLARLVDRVGKLEAMVAGCGLITVSMASLSACSDFYEMSAALGLWSLGSTLLSTAPVSYVSDIVPGEKRAQAIALLRTAGDVGFLLGASSAGAMADWTNLETAMHSTAGLLATATGWFAYRKFIATSGVSKSS